MATKIDQYIIDHIRQIENRAGSISNGDCILLGSHQRFHSAVENPKFRAKHNFNHLNELAKVFNSSFSEFFPIELFDENKSSND